MDALPRWLLAVAARKTMHDHVGYLMDHDNINNSEKKSLPRWERSDPETERLLVQIFIDEILRFLLCF